MVDVVVDPSRAISSSHGTPAAVKPSLTTAVSSDSRERATPSDGGFIITKDSQPDQADHDADPAKKASARRRRDGDDSASRDVSAQRANAQKHSGPLDDDPQELLDARVAIASPSSVIIPRPLGRVGHEDRSVVGGKSGGVDGPATDAPSCSKSRRESEEVGAVATAMEEDVEQTEAGGSGAGPMDVAKRDGSEAATGRFLSFLPSSFE